MVSVRREWQYNSAVSVQTPAVRVVAIRYRYTVYIYCTYSDLGILDW